MVKQKMKEMIFSYKTRSFPSKETIRKQIVFFYSNGFLTENEKLELLNLMDE